jgi:hypothetical protein
MKHEIQTPPARRTTSLGEAYFKNSSPVGQRIFSRIDHSVTLQRLGEIPKGHLPKAKDGSPAIAFRLPIHRNTSANLITSTKCSTTTSFGSLIGSGHTIAGTGESRRDRRTAGA